MKIALSGYYGFDNAGDEALLSAITSSIEELAPGTEFVVLSGDPDKTWSSHGIPAVYHKNPWKVFRTLKESDLLISGGGSIFQDVTSARSLPYYISVVALAKLLGKPVMFYAQGVGPINRSISKHLMRRVGNRVDLISLRDRESAQVLRAVGVDRPPSVITADPVFALQPGEQERREMSRYIGDSGWDRLPLIMVSVRQWPALEGYQNNLADALDRLADKGYNILFVPMAWPEDISESRRVMGLMKKTSYLAERKLHAKELLALVSQAHMVVGMRLHALIFAASQGTLFSGISYDPKVEAFLNVYGQAPLPFEGDTMLKRIEEILGSQEIKEDIQNKSRELGERSRENARLALSLIHK